MLTFGISRSCNYERLQNEASFKCHDDWHYTHIWVMSWKIQMLLGKRIESNLIDRSTQKLGGQWRHNLKTQGETIYFRKYRAPDICELRGLSDW